jgi:NAD(P)-dependent dehydrogenase (short-subunit alcohol dehydrogenase family)
VNPPTEQKVALVTGASRGIGRSVSRLLAEKGYKVYGTSRSPEAAEPEAAPENLCMIQMDVTSEDSVRETVSRILSEAGRIDILVNNAGISVAGPVEETPIRMARSQFETNYFGTLRMIQAVLPHMRGRGQGIICNIGSVAGKIALPFQAHYCASKFAIEGLTEALAIELEPFGIRVILIEPADVLTTIWHDRAHCQEKDSPYSKALGRFLKVKGQEMGANATPPEIVAREIVAAIESKGKRLRFGVSKGAEMLILARKLLPDSLMQWAVKRNYRQ